MVFWWSSVIDRSFGDAKLSRDEVRCSGSAEAVRRWTLQGKAVELESAPGQTLSVAYAVNADGSVIVGGSWSATMTTAVRWTEGSGTQYFDPLPGDVYAGFYGTNGDGSVAVGVSHPARPPSWVGPGPGVNEVLGLRRVESELVRAGVDMRAWKLIHAQAVSANGRVITGVGTARPKDGSRDFPDLLPIAASQSLGRTAPVCYECGGIRAFPWGANESHLHTWRRGLRHLRSCSDTRLQ